MSIKNMQKEAQPREKALLNGFNSLSDSELLAIFIRTGNKNQNVIQIANELLTKFQDFNTLSMTTLKELMETKGIGNTKAIELKAIFEMSKRILNISKKQINNNEEAANYASNFILDDKQEHFFILILNNKNEIIFQKILYSGTEGEITLSPKHILSEILKRDGNRIYCFHNHPSGVSKPSQEDQIMTESLQYYCDLFGIELLGHIILANKGDYSLIE